MNGTDGQDGANGVNCWDLNANGACDLVPEDVNGDGVCTTADCAGVPCWDLNGNLMCDSTSAAEQCIACRAACPCAGSAPAEIAICAACIVVCNITICTESFDAEDKDGDGLCTTADCQGPEGDCTCNATIVSAGFPGLFVAGTGSGTVVCPAGTTIIAGGCIPTYGVSGTPPPVGVVPLATPPTAHLIQSSITGNGWTCVYGETTPGGGANPLTGFVVDAHCI